MDSVCGSQGLFFFFWHSFPVLKEGFKTYGSWRMALLLSPLHVCEHSRPCREEWCWSNIFSVVMRGICMEKTVRGCFVLVRAHTAFAALEPSICVVSLHLPLNQGLCFGCIELLHALRCPGMAMSNGMTCSGQDFFPRRWSVVPQSNWKFTQREAVSCCFPIWKQLL